MITNPSNPVEKIPYRSELGITQDVLAVCMSAGFEGALISEISRKANLSHFATYANCSKLASAGMIRQVQTKRRRIFVITEKGISTFREFQRFCDIMKKLNIRY